MSLPQPHTVGIVPFACDNKHCRQYNLVKLVHLIETAPKLLVLPRLICAECGLEVPRVKWETLDVIGGST